MHLPADRRRFVLTSLVRRITGIKPMTLKELRDKRYAIAKKMRDMVGAAEAEDRGLNDSERADWKTLQGELDSTEERIARAELIETSLDGQPAEDQRRQEEDRARFEDRRKSTDFSNQDPSRPVNGFERQLALSTWSLIPAAVQPSVRGLDACRRLGIDVNQRTLELNLDRGCDADGVPFQSPRDRRDVNRQSEARQQQRAFEAELFRRDRAQYDRIREERAQSVGTTTAGGFTVPDEMMRAIDNALLQWGGMRRVATVLTTATGADLPIPTSNDTGNTGEIIAENTTVNEQDITFAQVVLQAYKYSSKMIRLSVELLQDSSVNMPAFLGDALGTRIGRITNAHFTTGTGTGQPRGVATAAATSGVTAASAGVWTYKEILQIKHSVNPAYRENANFMFNDTALRKMKQIEDSQNRPIWLPSLLPGEPATFDGDTYVINQSVASGAAQREILYGDFSKYYIRDTRGITLQRLDERYAELHQVAFLAFARMDGDLIDAGTNPIKYGTAA